MNTDTETQGFLTIWAFASGGVVFATSVLLLRYWARPGQNKFAQATIVFSWCAHPPTNRCTTLSRICCAFCVRRFLAFAVCFILPVDFVPSSDKSVLDVVW